MVFSINPTAAKTQAMFKQMAVSQNGTGEASPITGGTGGGNGAAGGGSNEQQTTVAAPPSQETSSRPAEGGSGGGGGTSEATPGRGKVGTDGSCSCIVSCSAGGFPAVAAQGVGAFGGMGGE